MRRHPATIKARSGVYMNNYLVGIFANCAPCFQSGLVLQICGIIYGVMTRLQE